MDRPLAFHTAARRHLTDRWQQLTAIGWELSAGGPDSNRDDWTPEAKKITPRYWVLQAARLILESFDPDNLPALAELVDRATDEVLTVPISQGHGDAEAEIVDDERRRLAQTLRELASSELSGIEPLPYRRSLSPAESSEWLARVGERWPISGKSWWDPITPESTAGLPYDTLVLQEDAFWKDRRTAEPGDATLAIRRALIDMGVDRVVELREWGPEHEVAVDDFLPTYTGAEGLFTSKAIDWLIFASHESATALGGSIVAALQRTWPESERARWTGWNLEPDADPEVIG